MCTIYIERRSQENAISYKKKGSVGHGLDVVWLSFIVLEYITETYNNERTNYKAYELIMWYAGGLHPGFSFSSHTKTTRTSKSLSVRMVCIRVLFRTRYSYTRNKV